MPPSEPLTPQSARLKNTAKGGAKMATPDLEISTLPNGDALLSVPTPQKQVCDFCRDSRVVVSYPCLDFGFEDANFYSRGAWAACSECRQMVDSGRFDDLARRVACIEASCTFEVLQLTEFLKMVYAVFSQLRTGPAQEVAP